MRESSASPTLFAMETNSADQPDAAHRVPAGTDDATVEAVGKVTAALEVVEQARGMLYAFHRLIGRADNELQAAVELLDEAGHRSLAEQLRVDLVGRNVIEGRWTFQIVEEFDDGYWQAFTSWERRVRDELLDGRRHVYEAQLKEAHRTHHHPGHAARPPES